MIYTKQILTETKDLAGPPPPQYPRPSPRTTMPPPPGGKQVTDAEAYAALTYYNQYTLRPSPYPRPSASVPAPSTYSWERVAVAREYIESQILRTRTLQKSTIMSPSIIEVKLQMSMDQNAHVTRLMNRIMDHEIDVRFEWCVVEITLRSADGEITNIQKDAGTAMMMHVIAKRCLSRQYKAVDVYHDLVTYGLTKPPVFPVMIERISARGKRGKYDSDDTSGYDSGSGSSSDSSVGHVRSKYLARKFLITVTNFDM